MSRLTVPPHLAREVRQFAADFAAVTAAWVRDGWHSAAEVEEWREVIRVDMSNKLSVCFEIDPRPREERVMAWCRTFGDLAKKMGATCK